MAERRLVAFARFTDAASADALVAWLAAHEIEAHVEGADPLGALLGGRVRVVIAEEDLPRAQWMRANTAPVAEDDARAVPMPHALSRTRAFALVLAAAVLLAALLSR